MKVLLINSDYGPDYLADLVNYYFISNRHEVFTNHRLDFMFNDFKISRTYIVRALLLWKIRKFIKKLCSSNKEEILDSVKKYDLIIFTSIQKF